MKSSPAIDSESLEGAVDKIANLISDNWEDYSFTGLLDGNAGIMLFISHIKDKKNVAEEITPVLENLFEVISSTDQIPNLGVGFGGLSWVVAHLINEGKLTKEYLSTIEEIIPFIEGNIRKDLTTNNYDLFYGYIGGTLILLELQKLGLDCRNLIDEILDGIKGFSIEDSNGIYWNDFENKEFANLGLAHGVPSLIILLSRIYDFTEQKELVHDLILKACKWILELECDSGVSLFGTTFGNDKHCEDSRLAWCYGDIGIALVLVLAGKKINNEQLINEGERIGIHSTSRLIKDAYVNDDESSGLDITFCHGTSGIAYLYLRLYDLTLNTTFKVAGDYWMELTLDGLYKKINYHENNGFSKEDVNGQMVMCRELGLLNGLAGVGLVVKSFLDEKSRSWDQMFLLR